jgi:hypothetical protein
VCVFVRVCSSSLASLCRAALLLIHSCAPLLTQYERWLRAIFQRRKLARARFIQPASRQDSTHGFLKSRIRGVATRHAAHPHRQRRAGWYACACILGRMHGCCVVPFRDIDIHIRMLTRTNTSRPHPPTHPPSACFVCHCRFFSWPSAVRRKTFR